MLAEVNKMRWLCEAKFSIPDLSTVEFPDTRYLEKVMGISRIVTMRKTQPVITPVASGTFSGWSGGSGLLLFKSIPKM